MSDVNEETTHREEELAIRKKQAKLDAALAAVEKRVGYSSDKTLARYFDVARSTIWEWTRTGKLPKPEKLSDGTSRFKNSKLKEAA